MEVSIWKSIFFALTEIFLWLIIFRQRKSKKKLQGFFWMIISLISSMCYQSILLGILNIIHVPVNIVTAGLIAGLSALLLGVKNRNKEKQQYQWSRYECIGVIIIIAVLVYKFYGLFTPEFQALYWNSDIAVHFKGASMVVHNQEIHNMYFSSMYGAFFIEMFAPFVSQIVWYKLFILYDGLMFLLEGLFVWSIFNRYADNFKIKLLAPFFFGFWIFGFPANAFLFSFIYVNMGVMIFAYILCGLKIYDERALDDKYVNIMLLLGCGAITTTYIIYGPFVFVLTFIIWLTIIKKNSKVVTFKNVKSALQIFLVPTLISIYYCYFDFLLKTDKTASGIATIEGACYREFWADFLLLVPLCVYYFLVSFKEKKCDVFGKALLIVGILFGVLFVLTYEEHLSVYYFNKIYYPLWLLCFIVAMMGMKKLMEKDNIMVITYILCYAFAAIVCFKNIENKIVWSERGFTENIIVTRFFNVYTTNKMMVGQRIQQIAGDYQDVTEHAVELINQENTYIPMLVDLNYDRYVYWYEGITGQDEVDYYGWNHSMKTLQKEMKRDKVKYVVAYRDSQYVKTNEKFFSSCEVVYSNGSLALYKVKAFAD